MHNNFTHNIVMNRYSDNYYPQIYIFQGKFTQKNTMQGMYGCFKSLTWLANATDGKNDKNYCNIFLSQYCYSEFENFACDLGL